MATRTFPPPPTKELFEEARARSEWWDVHRDDFLRLLEGSSGYVAVQDGVVVATSRRLFDLLDRLDALGLANDPEVDFDYVRTDEDWLLLL